MHVDLFLFFNSFVNQTPLFDQVLFFVAEYLWVILVLLVEVIVIAPRLVGKKGGLRMVSRQALVALLAAATAWSVATIIKYFSISPRPFVIVPEAILLFEQMTPLLPLEALDSFPSGHTSFVMALGVAMYLMRPRIGVWFVIAALLVGVSRIIVGVHWPLDILGGIIVGAFVAWVLYYAARLTHYI